VGGLAKGRVSQKKYEKIPMSKKTNTSTDQQIKGHIIIVGVSKSNGRIKSVPQESIVVPAARSSACSGTMLRFPAVPTATYDGQLAPSGT
jgi:hypothetical protein